MSGDCLTDILDAPELFERLDTKEQYIASVCAQILEGLNYFHNRNYIHCNLQSDNILFGLIFFFQS
jgi:serine/threonine protein kinase